MPISAITALAVENAGGQGQGGCGAGVCRGDTNGALAWCWGHSRGSLLADPRQIPTGDGSPSPCLQTAAPREGPNPGARGIQGHGPCVATLMGTCESHPRAPRSPVNTRKWAHMYTHMHMRVQGPTHGGSRGLAGAGAGPRGPKG